MVFKQLFFCLVLIFVCDVSAYNAIKNCDDCINMFECPAGVELFNKRDAASSKQLSEAFCGYGDNKLPKVCCNDFQPKDNSDVEQHPNLRLLPDSCGVFDGKRIIGGESAGIYEFPWMVLISYNTRVGVQFECGGTLINERYVLTAAHCIINQRIAGVRVGEFNIATSVDCQGVPPKIVCEDHIQDIRVEESVYHKEYKGKPYVTNDIGLLRLKTPVDFSKKNADTICLPLTSSLRYKDIGNQTATVTGWGATESGYTSSVLLKVKLPVYTKERCKTYYNRGRHPDDTDVTENLLCAGEFGKDSCKGDSGGPLMLEDKYKGGERYIQHGIVSNGPIQCGSEFPGVYTNVAKYVKWILDNIKE